jgi:hypothetical protein
MALVTVVAAEVTTGQSTIATPSYLTSEAITAGEAVYYNSTTNVVTLANNAAAGTSSVKGIAMTSDAVGGGYILVAESGIIDPGFTVTVGHLYYLGATDGKIAPVGDVTSDSGAYVSAIYRGKTTSTVKLEINNTGDVIA